MAYRTLVFPNNGMANAINLSVSLPLTPTPKRVSKLTFKKGSYTSWHVGPTRKRRAQYIIGNIYLNVNKGNTLTEDGGTNTLLKGKGSILECGNFTGKKLMSHTLKLFERIINHI